MNVGEWQSLPPARAALEVCARVAALDPALRRAALAAVPTEAELTAAFEAADAAAPLGRVPFLLKDLFDVTGMPTRAGSTFLPEMRPVPSEDSSIVRALRNAGAVFAGKTNLQEFALGLTGENPHYGDCMQAKFPDRLAGGSSSGSAALVAAGVVPLAIGTDTGGSIRVPAAFCGIYGFRLTPGGAWISDAVPLSPSFDTAGWFAANAGDMLLTTAALCGLGMSKREPHGCYLEPDGLDEDVALACRNAAHTFAPTADSSTRRDLLEGFAQTPFVYDVIRGIESVQFHREWMDRYRDRYDPQVLARLETGLHWTDAQQEATQVALATTKIKWTQFFLTYDFLVMPATPIPAPTKVGCTAANRERIFNLVAPASVGGLPVLTIPVPLPSGLSSGLQIITNNPQSPVIAWALRRMAA